MYLEIRTDDYSLIEARIREQYESGPADLSVGKWGDVFILSIVTREALRGLGDGPSGSSIDIPCN
jgi:hypothetical protein